MEGIAMNLTFNPSVMRFIRNILIIILITKIISLVVLWYFQGEGVNYRESNSKMPEYKRYNINNFIKPVQKPIAEQNQHKMSAEEQELAEVYGPNIETMVLKGLVKYDKGGLVIVALKNKPKNSELLAIGEDFQGYTLKKVLENAAIFEKRGELFSLYFSEEDKKKRKVVRPTLRSSGVGGIKQVAKADIVNYAKDVKQIWRDIGIVEVKKNGKITGFKVTRIKSNTPFAQLGLRKGDIIIKANNKPMKSYKDAIGIYKGIDKLEALELVVLRNNQETEIVYEIY